MNNDILLSFCIPTFNRAERLIQCVEEILKLPFHNIEIVISDNNSDDKTENKVIEKMKIDSRVKYYKNKKNVGAEKNFILSMEHAKGTYVYLTSDEDLINVDFFRKLLTKDFSFSIIVGSVFDRESNKFYYKEITRVYKNLNAVKNLSRLIFRNYISGIILKKELIDFDYLHQKTDKKTYYSYTAAIMMCASSEFYLNTLSDVICFKGHREKDFDIKAFDGNNKSDKHFSHPEKRTETIFQWKQDIEILFEKKNYKVLFTALSRIASIIFFHMKDLRYDDVDIITYYNQIKNMKEIGLEFKYFINIHKVILFFKKIKKFMKSGL